MTKNPQSRSNSVKKANYTVAGFNALPMTVDVSFPAVTENNQGLVIYAHGINGFKDWGGMNNIATEFAKAGWTFLKFNFSHNGTTPAYPEDFVHLDAYAEDSYLKRQFDLQQIFTFVDETLQADLNLLFKRKVLIGHSRGGADAILFAAKENSISHLITWASVAHAKTPWSNLDLDAMAQWKENGIYTRPNGRTKQKMPISYSLYEEWQANKKELDVESAARKISMPWLIVHGDEDEAVFVKDAYVLKECCPEAKVAIIENANHTFGRVHPWNEQELPPDTRALIEHSLNFLAEA